MKRFTHFVGFLLVNTIFISSCYTGTGQYKNKDWMKNTDATAAHYLYQNNDISVAAKIVNGRAYNSFIYYVMIVNNSDKPLPMNYFGDYFYVYFQGKQFATARLMQAQLWPSAINPDSYQNVSFIVDKRFNKVINQVDSVAFHGHAGKFTLHKNPNAVWE